MFEGFTQRRVAVDETTINVVVGGSGPPILLLHGYPQTHAMWHQVAPRLAEDFTVVCTDLRGYGDSDVPPTDARHSPYSKRAMANDQLGVMHELGFERFTVVGHDRGARVARRLALDHRAAVECLVILDIVPTATIYSVLDQARASIVWRYFFLIQPEGLPERMIGLDPVFYLRWTVEEWSGPETRLSPKALAEYERCFDPGTIHASCEDYRAGATIDLVHDAEDDDRTIGCPVMVLWTKRLGATYDVLASWREQAEDVTGHAVECGHFLPEEKPGMVASEIRAFVRASL
jgi:haloacetate dehalogenase